MMGDKERTRNSAFNLQGDKVSNYKISKNSVSLTTRPGFSSKGKVTAFHGYRHSMVDPAISGEQIQLSHKENIKRFKEYK